MVTMKRKMNKKRIKKKKIKFRLESMFEQRNKNVFVFYALLVGQKQFIQFLLKGEYMYMYVFCNKAITLKCRGGGD